MAILTELGHTAERFFRTFMRDGGFKDDDPRLKKIFFGGFLFGAIEGSHVNGNRDEVRHKIRGLEITVQQMLQEED